MTGSSGIRKRQSADELGDLDIGVIKIGVIQVVGDRVNDIAIDSGAVDLGAVLYPKETCKGGTSP